MFTGIILEVGTVASARRTGGSMHFSIRAPRVGPGLSVHDSVAVNGACLTVTESAAGVFTVEAVEETLQKTTLGSLRPSAPVNLEPAMKLGDRMGGHLVQGHVDCVGSIRKITRRESSWIFEIAFPAHYRRYVIPVGSIAVDGISLTVASVQDSSCLISVIPYTFENTIWKEARAEQAVNLEFDLIGKYVENLVTGTVGGSDSISEEKLRRWGYLP